MPPRPVSKDVVDDWSQLASIFENLHGGTPAGQRAARYLRGLATGTLPLGELLPLQWHSDEVVQVMPQVHEEPHACVLAVLCPSVPLRAVWRRGR